MIGFDKAVGIELLKKTSKSRVVMVLRRFAKGFEPNGAKSGRPRDP
jgi:hypothetical protein